MDSYMDQLREIFGPEPENLSQDDKTWLRHVLSKGLIKDPLEVAYLCSHLERMGTPVVLTVPAWDQQDREENWIYPASSFTKEDAVAALRQRDLGSNEISWNPEEIDNKLFLFTDEEESVRYIVGDAAQLLDEHLDYMLCSYVGTAHLREAGASQAVVAAWENAADGYEQPRLLGKLVPELPLRRAILWACLEDCAAEGVEVPWGALLEVDCFWAGNSKIAVIQCDDG